MCCCVVYKVVFVFLLIVISCVNASQREGGKEEQVGLDLRRVSCVRRILAPEVARVTRTFELLRVGLVVGSKKFPDRAGVLCLRTRRFFFVPCIHHGDSFRASFMCTVHVFFLQCFPDLGRGLRNIWRGLDVFCFTGVSCLCRLPS